jgi:hypothetical protein
MGVVTRLPTIRVVDEKIRDAGSIRDELSANARCLQSIFSTGIRAATIRPRLLRPGVSHSAKDSRNSEDALGQHA